MAELAEAACFLSMAPYFSLAREPTPKDKYGETRCYIRDPDGYIIEVGQSNPDFTYG